MSFNDKQTSESIASLASAVLLDAKASVIGKKLAGSALAQSSTNKQTGAEMESLASQILRENNHSQSVLRLACLLYTSPSPRDS